MVTRVREMLERSRRSLADSSTRQRLEGSTKQLLERSRATVAQLVGPTQGKPAEPPADEVLAGVCSSVALRDLNLVDSLLEQLEKMEANEDDPESLAQLYKLDHLATRLRRNGENLRVLAGREAGHGSDASASLVDVVRAAMSSIEHYQRVEFGKITDLGVVGFAADDISRLLAELLDNATTHSPPTSEVTVSAHLTEQGSVMIRVDDAGIGLPSARLSALNERLATAPVLDRNAVQHMGLAVVRRLANRYDIRVWLARRAPHGTTASVLVPASLVQDSSAERRGPQDSDRASGGANPKGSVFLDAEGLREKPERRTPPPSRTAAPRTRSEPATPPDSTEGGSAEQPSAAPSASGLPKRRPGAQSAPTQEKTSNGLPRRVPQSLKESAPTASAPSETTEQQQRDGHERLLADLDAFAEGEQAAQGDLARTDTENTQGTDK